MNINQSKIFSTYYIKKDNKIVGPLRYEQIKEIMYNKKFIGNESISLDQKIWENIRTVLPELDSFLSSEQEELYNDTFLKLINKNSKYKIKTTFNITMGPFNNEKLLNLIKQDKIEYEYEIHLEDMNVLFKKIRKRLFRKLDNIINNIINEEDKKFEKVEVAKDDLEKIDSISAIDISKINSFINDSDVPKIKIKEINKLSEDNIKGLLSTKPLLSLLFIYSLDKLTGILEISKKNEIFELSFKKGKLAYINSNKFELSLGEYLRTKKGIIVNQDKNLPDSLLIPKLISENKLEASKLYDLLKELILFRFKEIFKITNGKFLFKQGVVTEDTSLNIDFLSNLWKFTSKLIPEKTINSYISKVENFVIIKDKRRFSYNEYFKLGPIELKLLNKINNKITTKQFISILQKQKPEVVKTLKTLIYILYNLKFVQQGEEISSINIVEEIKTIKDKIDKIEKENNHFTTLGISQDTPLAQIRKIYIKAAKDYHPDKLNKETNEELKTLKTSLYTYISTAYNKISTQQKLDEYIEELKNVKEGGRKNFDAELLFKSEELFNRCKKAIKVGKFERALEFINEATSLFNENQEFYVYKYYLDFLFSWQTNLTKAKTSLNNLEKLMKTLEKYPDGFRFLGRMYRNLKEDKKAKFNFKKLLSLVSYDAEAKREIR